MLKLKQIKITVPLIISFCALISIFFLFGIFSLYEIRKISNLNETVYNHPLVVSNATLKANVYITEMLQSMKDMLLLNSSSGIQQAIKDFNREEKEVYTQLNIVKENILGKEGLFLEKKVRKLFGEWKPIRNKVIEFISNGQREKAVKITTGIGAKHVALLEIKMLGLTKYAENKASDFNLETKQITSKLNSVLIFLLVTCIFISILVAIFILKFTLLQEKNLQIKEKTLFQFLEAIPVGIFVLDGITGSPYYANQMSKKILGQGIIQTNKSKLAQVYKVYIAGTNNEYPIEKMPLIKALSGKVSSVSDMEIHRPDDKLLLHVTASPVRDDETGTVIYAIAAFIDITARRKMEIELNHSRKLEAVGQLAAGIAHEINTPTQYIGDNTNFLKDSFTDLLQLIEEYESLRNAGIEKSITQQMLDQLEEKVEETDLQYLLSEIPLSIEQSMDGIKKVSNIVSAMKEFSHPGQEGKVLTDINRCLENTIMVSRNEWKYVADLKTDMAKELPEINCYPNELNQVFLNIIINGAHAISEKQIAEGNNQKGIITVSTSLLDSYLEIRIQDTGTGVPDNIKNKILDPFFTTKEIGKGTGQGLAIANSIVVSKHGGKFYFESLPGIGTTFIILLPLDTKETKTNNES